MDDLNWLQSLRVGDMVEDCRYKAQRIAQIDYYYRTRVPRWFWRLTDPDWVPLWVWTVGHWFFTKFGSQELVDCDLILEDGSRCSAVHCCAPHSSE